MVLPPIAVGRPICRIIFNFSRSKRILWMSRCTGLLLRLKRRKATVAGTILANRVASAAPAVPMFHVIMSSGSRIIFNRIPPRFKNIGRTVSPCA